MKRATTSSRQRSRRDVLRSAGMAAVATGFLLAGCSEKGAKTLPNGEEAKLRLQTGGIDFGQSVLEDFERQQNLELTLDAPTNDEQLFAKLAGRTAKFDVAEISSDMVGQMARNGMILPLDHALVANRNILADGFRDPAYDRANQHSIPFSWQVFGIAYRKSRVDGTPDSWASLFESDRNSGKIALLSDAEAMFRLHAIYRGKSANALTAADISDISGLMVKQKRHVAGFLATGVPGKLVSGEINLALCRNGDVAAMIADDPDIDFVIPREGSLIRTANLCIAKTSKHPKNAHALLNHLLDAGNAKKAAEEGDFPTTNAGARLLFGKDYTDNVALSPPEDRLKKCEYLTNPIEMQNEIREAFALVRSA